MKCFTYILIKDTQILKESIMRYKRRFKEPTLLGGRKADVGDCPQRLSSTQMIRRERKKPVPVHMSSTLLNSIKIVHND